MTTSTSTSTTSTSTTSTSTTSTSTTYPPSVMDIEFYDDEIEISLEKVM